MARLMKLSLALVFLIGGASAAPAAETRAVFSVHQAGCELCAPIVEAILRRVGGVSLVEIAPVPGTMDLRVIVTYDDALTSSQALIRATTDQGYPAEIVQ